MRVESHYLIMLSNPYALASNSLLSRFADCHEEKYGYFPWRKTATISMEWVTVFNNGGWDGGYMEFIGRMENRM